MGTYTTRLSIDKMGLNNSHQQWKRTEKSDNYQIRNRCQADDVGGDPQLITQHLRISASTTPCKMAYNSGGSNPIGVKTGPRPEDAYVPPVNSETLGSIERAADRGTEEGQMKREGVVGKSNQIFNC